MRRQNLKMAAAASLIVTLSSCQGLMHTLGFSGGSKVRSASADAVSATPATDEGRSRLDAGQPGLAIESFQRALGSGEPVAPALNGIGVAYARMDRYDLADRFFREAMAAAPGDERYAANIMRLSRSPAFAQRKDGDVARQVAAASAVAAAGGDPMMAEANPAADGAIQRLSRGEVLVRTMVPQGGPRPQVQSAELANFRPQVRVALVPSAQPAAPAEVDATTADAIAAAAAPAPAPKSMPATIAFRPESRSGSGSAATPVARMQRVSRGEVRIVTVTTEGRARVAVRDRVRAPTAQAIELRPVVRSVDGTGSE